MYVLSMFASLIFVVVKTPHLANVIYQKYQEKVKKGKPGEERKNINIYSQFEVEFLGLDTVTKANRGFVRRQKSMFDRLEK